MVQPPGPSPGTRGVQPATPNTNDDDSQPGPSASQPQPSSNLQSEEPQSPLAHIRARLARFKPIHGDHHHHHDPHSDEENSEDELLLDPNLPADYSQRHQAIPLHPLPTIDHDHDPSIKTSLDSDRAPLVPAEDADDGDGNDQQAKEVEDSPYPEVRAAVHPYDDHSLPCNTLRAWAIGLSLIFLGASINTLFSLRSPSISLGALIAQVIAWYVPSVWRRLLPLGGKAESPSQHWP